MDDYEDIRALLDERLWTLLNDHERDIALRLVATTYMRVPDAPGSHFHGPYRLNRDEMRLRLQH